MSFLSKVVASPGWYVFWGMFSLFFFVLFAFAQQPVPAALHAVNVIYQFWILSKYLKEQRYEYRRD